MAPERIPTQVLTYKFRVLPSKRQHAALARICEAQRQLYNAAIQERRDCYSKTGKGRSYIDQCKSLTEWRQSDEDARALPVNLQRWTLRRTDDAYKAFYRRIKDRNGAAGFPRFKGKGRWNSFGFNQFSGIRFDGTRLRFAGMPGSLRVHLHRPLPDGKPLACVFRRDVKGWYVCFQMLAAGAERRELTCCIGVDVGLASLATLSTGEQIPNPRHARKAAKELRRRQRALSRCKRGSKRREKVRAMVARLHRKVADTRSTHLHQVSADLVRRFDLIAVEKLNVKGMSRGMLAKSVNDASWGMLRQMLAYKAEKAGAQLIEVDPRHTSQICPECGQIEVKTLSQRTHRCGCGCVMDRDHASALVILDRAVVGPRAQKQAGYG